MQRFFPEQKQCCSTSLALTLLHRNKPTRCVPGCQCGQHSLRTDNQVHNKLKGPLGCFSHRESLLPNCFDISAPRVVVSVNTGADLSGIGLAPTHARFNTDIIRTCSLGPHRVVAHLHTSVLCARCGPRLRILLI